jgi:hypothetical protein
LQEVQDLLVVSPALLRKCYDLFSSHQFTFYVLRVTEGRGRVGRVFLKQ